MAFYRAFEVYIGVAVLQRRRCYGTHTNAECTQKVRKRAFYSTHVLKKGLKRRVNVGL